MFQVTVWRCGKLIATKENNAINALSACEIAEKMFGTKKETLQTGKSGESLPVTWYGVKTVARRIAHA